MKILVCGNGPSLLRQLKGKKLDIFDKVVRVNAWKPIEGYDNRCDAWVFYPRHAMQWKNPEARYEFEPYLKIKEYWLAHAWAKEEVKKVAGRYPDYALTEEEFNGLMNEARDYTPTTGVMAIYMATLISKDVWIAGFDCYEGGQTYYYKEGISNDMAHIHNPAKDKLWIEKQIKEGRVKVL